MQDIVFFRKVSAKGEVIIPKKLRQLIGIKPGGKVLFIPQKEGKLEIKPL